MIPEGIAGCGRDRLNPLLDGAAGTPFLLGGVLAGSFFQGFIISGAFFLRGVCTRFFDAFRRQLCLTCLRSLNLALSKCNISDFLYQLAGIAFYTMGDATYSSRI